MPLKKEVRAWVPGWGFSVVKKFFFQFLWNEWRKTIPLEEGWFCIETAQRPFLTCNLLGQRLLIDTRPARDHNDILLTIAILKKKDNGLIWAWLMILGYLNGQCCVGCNKAPPPDLRRWNRGSGPLRQPKLHLLLEGPPTWQAETFHGSVLAFEKASVQNLLRSPKHQTGLIRSSERGSERMILPQELTGEGR